MSEESAQAWCEASGPGNGRASSQWREVTCPQCTAKGMAWLRALAVAIAAPQARSGCPGGQHVAVTGHTAVVIGSRTVTVPVYGCKP